MKRMLSGLLELVYPHSCPICGRRITTTPAAVTVCAQCRSCLALTRPPFCLKCGRGLPHHTLPNLDCIHCKGRAFYFDRAFSPFYYQSPLKELIHQFKYAKGLFLASCLADFLIEFITRYGLLTGTMFLIPVPLHPARLRQREYNQSQVLAEKIAKRLNARILTGCLRRNRNTRSQTDLSSLARWQNVQDAFSAGRSIKEIRGKELLLIDDVVTTGATASEAAKVLKNAGAQRVSVLSLAVSP
jgi:ComF family protein